MGHAKRWIGTGVWVGTLIVCIGGASSCTPGELDENQEKFLRKEIKERYPAPNPEKDASAEDTDDTNVDPEDTNDSDVQPDNSDVVTDDESTSVETSEVTSEAESTSTAVTTSSESSDVTSGEADAGGGAGGQVPDCFVQMVTTTCSGSVCHYGGAFNFPPNFESENLFEMLTTTGSTCSTRNSDFYIDVANPENSYLPQRVLGEGCGTPMPPPGEGEISAAERECLEGWLESL